ncbi:MAG TPA: ABC transporter substrate-binding protein [Methylomirabilota bacterium]|jgi:branched-chain amino acid transport system substrate-binding protein|nr:ABC transporter substrate-binding protein [Methylomirabilota bacterium]
MPSGLRIWFLVTVLVAGLAAPALAQRPVKIGVLTPLSPPGDASAGQFIVRGAKMGADEVNSRGGVLGGRKVELVIEDDSGTPEKGAAGFRKLATQDQVAAVVGQFHSSVMGAVQDLAEQFRIPVFATQASARGITERHLNYTFRTHVIDPDRVKLWNQWIKERGFKRVALIAENTDYGVGVVEETRGQFKTMDVKAELKTTIFDRTSVDLTPQLLEIKSWNPDLLLNVGVGTPVYLMIKQAYDVGLFPAVPMLVSYDLPARPEYWKNLGEKGNYLVFIAYYHPTMKLTSRGEAMRKKYREQFNEDPVYGALNGYAQVLLLADALNAAKSDKGEELVKALLANKFEGWNASIGFARGEGPYWQQWTPPMLFMQYTKPDMPFTDAKIVFPAEFKTGDLMPAPKR